MPIVPKGFDCGDEITNSLINEEFTNKISANLGIDLTLMIFSEFEFAIYPLLKDKPRTMMHP